MSVDPWDIVRWTRGYPFRLRAQIVRMFFTEARFNGRWWPTYDDAEMVGVYMRRAMRKLDALLRAEGWTKVRGKWAKEMTK